MSMDEFIQTLTEEQKQALLKALSGGSFEPEVSDKPLTTHPPFIDGSRWQHEEPVSQAVDGDFSMKPNEALVSKRRSPVRAGKNTWIDQGECRGKEVETPDIKPTPRNRKPPAMKEVICHVCGNKSKVNASLVHGEFYRCDRCSGNK